MRFHKRKVALALALPLLLAAPIAAERIDTTIEKAIGGVLARALTSGAGLDEDPLLTPWVRRIGADIAACSPRDDVKPRFYVLDSDVSNAQALPGGYVLVTRGLLESVSSDDELAGVLAHEAAHVAKKHAIAHLAENAFALGLVNLLGKRQETRTAGTLLNALRGLSRSRAMEAQADEVGLGIAAAAGYDPRGLARFLEGFAGNRPTRLEEYVATHPAPAQRLVECRRHPLIALRSPDDREAIAALYAARGLSGAARRVRAGGDPLALPPLPAPSLPPALSEERLRVAKLSSGALSALSGAFKAQRVGGTLQQFLLFNNQSDWRWIALALQAYSLQSRIQDGYARTVRSLRLAPGVWDGLSGEDDESRAGRAVVLSALEEAAAAREPLSRAASAATAALVDLNNRFVRLDGSAEWARYATLEGLVRYAESELQRVDGRSQKARRLLALARIRSYQRRLDSLVSEGDEAARALWRRLAERRLGSEPREGGGPTGAASIRACLALQLGLSEGETDARRGELSWAQAVERSGRPESVAIVLRLLTLELERELSP